MPLSMTANITALGITRKYAEGSMLSQCWTGYILRRGDSYILSWSISHVALTRKRSEAWIFTDLSIVENICKKFGLVYEPINLNISPEELNENRHQEWLGKLNKLKQCQVREAGDALSE